MSRFLQKQGILLIENERYALALTFLFAVLPLFSWVAVTIVCLITLRRGYQAGTQFLAIASLATLLSLFFMSADAAILIENLAVLLISFLLAWLLRLTTRWKSVGIVLLLTGLLSIVIISTFYPMYLEDQFQLVKAIVHSFKSQSLYELMEKANDTALKDYLFGIKVVSVVISIISSLTLARYIQSMAFYPEGFKQEMLNFQANSWVLVLALLIILGAFQANGLAVQSMPLITVYFMLAGLSLMCHLMDKKNKKQVMLLLIIPVIVIPYVMLPAFAVMGALDSLFNFRLRLHKVGI